MNFVPGHISVTRLLEASLQSVDPSVAFPYWEYTIDVEDVIANHAEHFEHWREVIDFSCLTFGKLYCFLLSPRLLRRSLRIRFSLLGFNICAISVFQIIGLFVSLPEKQMLPFTDKWFGEARRDTGHVESGVFSSLKVHGLQHLSVPFFFAHLFQVKN